MCDDCLLTRAQGAKMVKRARQSRGDDAYVTLIEHLVWIFEDASDDLEDVDITQEEADQIFEEIRIL